MDGWFCIRSIADSCTRKREKNLYNWKMRSINKNKLQRITTLTTSSFMNFTWIIYTILTRNIFQSKRVVWCMYHFCFKFHEFLEHLSWILIIFSHANNGYNMLYTSHIILCLSLNSPTSLKSTSRNYLRQTIMYP